MDLIKRPEAFIPILMSLAAIALVLGFLIISGVPTLPQQDEGTAAHVWQILMGGQLPIIVFFAIRRFPQESKKALRVFVFQAAAFSASLAVLFIFEHVLQ